MEINFINIGFGNVVNINRIIAIVNPESAPIKRVVQDARANGILLDATHGRRTRSVIVFDSKQVVLSAVLPETIKTRITNKESLDDVL